MTALIRAALKTDPSEVQPPRNAAVHTPSGGGGGRGTRAPGPGPRNPSKLLLIRPWGRTLTTLFHNEPPSFPPLHFLTLTLPPSLPPSSVSLVYQAYVHPGASFTQAKGGLGGGGWINKCVDLWIIRSLIMKAKAKKTNKKKTLPLPPSDIRQMLSEQLRWAAFPGMFKKKERKWCRNLLGAPVNVFQK